MVTYPSTHGAYEDTITELCEIVHAPRRPGLRRRRQPQRAARARQARRVRRRRLAPEPAQDLLHPPRRRRPGRRPGRGARAPRAVPALARACTPRRPSVDGIGPISAAPYGSAGILPISWAYVRLMGGRRADPRHRGRGAGGQLRRRPARRALPGALPRPRRAGRPRVHPRRPRADQGHRRHRRRRRQAAGRLRLPRPDHVVPGGRHPDGRADRVRGPRRDRPVLRRDDRHPRRDRPGRGGGVDAGGLPAARRPAHRARPGRRVGPRLRPRRWRSSRPASTPTSTGRRSAGSTRPTATATWSAPARRSRPSPRARSVRAATR